VLAALAGDHANATTDLRRSLAVNQHRLVPLQDLPLAVLLTDAARATWVDFQNRAEPDAIRIWTADVSRILSMRGNLPRADNPRDFVRALDAELWAVDADYVGRAKNAKTHFHDPTSPIDVVLAQAALGSLDNVLAQMLAHHARSLQLAWRGRKPAAAGDRQLLRAEALLEHAFALHFMEDAFAAGHIATDPAVAADERRAERHDYFNRQGLAVTRGLSPYRCTFQPKSPLSRNMGLSPCWVAHGDGFATIDDRLYVGEAVARLQTQFALALQPVDGAWIEEQVHEPSCSAWLGGGPAEEACDLAWAAMLLDPNPEWLHRTPCERGTVDGRVPSTADWARAVLTQFLDALDALGNQPLLAQASAGTPRAQPRSLSPDVVGAPLGALPNSQCTYSDFPATLWRPLLAAWPSAQSDVATLAGSDVFHRGFQLQVVASALGASTRMTSQDRTLGVWGGLGMGIAFATRGIFPHRASRSFFEANAGFAQGFVQGGEQPAMPSLLVAEVRIPITTLAFYGLGRLWQSRGPLGVVGDGWSLGLMGSRAYWSTEDQPRIVGWDAEILNIGLGGATSGGSAVSGVLDAEVRARIGTRTIDLAPLPSFFGGSVFVALELTSGYYQTLR